MYTGVGIICCCCCATEWDLSLDCYLLPLDGLIGRDTLPNCARTTSVRRPNKPPYWSGWAQSNSNSLTSSVIEHTLTTPSSKTMPSLVLQSNSVRSMLLSCLQKPRRLLRTLASMDITGPKAPLLYMWTRALWVRTEVCSVSCSECCPTVSSCTVAYPGHVRSSRHCGAGPSRYRLEGACLGLPISAVPSSVECTDGE